MKIRSFTPSPALSPFPSVANSVPTLVSLLLNFVNWSNICNPLVLRPFGKMKILVSLSFPLFLSFSTSQFLIFYLYVCLVEVDSICLYYKLIIKPFLFCLWKLKAQCLHYVDDATLFPESQAGAVRGHSSFMLTVLPALCLIPENASNIGIQ